MFRKYTDECVLLVPAKTHLHPTMLEMSNNVLDWLKSNGITKITLLFGIGDAINNRKVKTCDYAPFLSKLQSNFNITAFYCKRYIDSSDIAIYEDINTYEVIQNDLRINKVEHEIQDNSYLIALLKEKKMIVNFGCNLDVFNSLFSYLTRVKHANTYIRVSYTGISAFVNGAPLKIETIGLSKYSKVINRFENFRDIDKVDSEIGLFKEFADLNTQ